MHDQPKQHLHRRVTIMLPHFLYSLNISLSLRMMPTNTEVFLPVLAGIAVTKPDFSDHPEMCRMYAQ